MVPHGNPLVFGKPGYVLTMLCKKERRKGMKDARIEVEKDKNGEQTYYSDYRVVVLWCH
jgi:hypothetical protein